MTHSDLVEIGRKWLLRPYRNGSQQGHGGCRIVLTELVAYNTYSEIPDVIGFDQGKGQSILIECKTSLSDFRADQRKMFRQVPNFGIGDQRWFLAPEKIVPVEELPRGWGLIEVQENGRIFMVKPSQRFEKHAQSEIQLLISLVCRLDFIPDNSIAIRVFTPMETGKPPKKNATASIVKEAGHDGN